MSKFTQCQLTKKEPYPKSRLKLAKKLYKNI